MKVINELDELRAFCNQFDSIAAASRELGVSRQYLTDIVNEKKDLSKGIVEKLGIKRVSIKSR